MDEFWRGRRVFLTGHTGFKGAWLSLWLRELGAEVTGYALEPNCAPNLFGLLQSTQRSIIADVRDAARLRAAMLDAAPHVVLHLAAQALVRESYRDPLGTFTTNVVGTANLLQACRELPRLQCVLVITSDKVYANRGGGRAFQEDDELGGHDPYSSSKACTELVTQSYRDSFFSPGPPVASARAGNVIGGGDWSQDRLIPDCIRAIAAQKPVLLRFPDAVRPWQHVLEPLSGYLAFAQALTENPSMPARSMNFGPSSASFCKVREVVEVFSERFSGRPGWNQDTASHPAEAQFLTLSSDRANAVLNWRPKLGVAESVAWTADWYQAHAAGSDMLEFSRTQLSRYRSASA